jgi:hypothetical protein
MSTFLVHLTRAQPGEHGLNEKEVLKKIISDWTLIQGRPQGPAASRLRAAGQADSSQQVVCFTETPMEHIKLLTEEITGRECQFAQYGVAITRKQGRRAGVNPIWYLDQTPGQAARWLGQDLEALITAAIANPAVVGLERVFRITPFIEQMGTWATRRKEFWWEREWRFVGDLPLPDRVVILCPEGDFEELGEHIAASGREPHCQMLDPCWSLERMIAHLAGFDAEDVGSP